MLDTAAYNYTSRRRRFWHAKLRSTIRRHHPPQRAVLSQICCFWERKVVLFQILLDDAEPLDAIQVHTIKSAYVFREKKGLEFILKC